MRLPRVPRERVIDAAPLAIVIIMVSFPYFIPLGVPFSLLHMWLWLRYPRSKSRYLTFAAITGFILFLFVVLPVSLRLLYVYLSIEKVSDKKFPLTYIPLILTSLLTGGILPILYRLSSRRSLSAREDVATQVAESHTRTGISDLLVLITISAGVLGLARLPRQYFTPFYAPTWDIALTLVASAFGLLAMRLNARASRALSVAAFVGVFVGGYAALRGTLWGLDYARRHWFDYPNWLAGANSWDVEDTVLSVPAFCIAIYPILCRRCGVELVDPRTNQALLEVQTGGTKVARSKLQQLGAFAAELAGHVSLLLGLSVITLYPFTVKDEYGSDGYRSAGWPFQFQTAEQIESTNSPWFWTAAEIWEYSDMDTVALAGCILFTLLLWQAILPLPIIASAFRGRALLYFRIAVVVACLVFLYDSAVGQPKRRNLGLEQVASVEIDKYERPLLGLIPWCASTLDVFLRGEPNGLEPGNATVVKVVNASQSDLDKVVLLPMTQILSFERCKMTDAHISELLQKRKLYGLTFIRCELSAAMEARLIAERKFKVVTIVEDQRRADYRFNRYGAYGNGSFDASQPRYDLELSTNRNEIHLSDSVRALRLLVPGNGDSRFRITHAKHLTSLTAGNRYADIVNAVCELSIADAPVLEEIQLDNQHQFALKIESSPGLTSIRGYYERVFEEEARLKSLSIKGSHQLSTLLADLSECDRLEIEEFLPINSIHWLRFSGSSGLLHDESVRLDNKVLLPFFESLLKDTVVFDLELQGLVIDEQIFKTIPTVENKFQLLNCDVPSNVFDSADRFSKNLSTFHATDFKPNSRQLTQFLNRHPFLESLQISGANLKTLPAEVGKQMSLVAIHSANFEVQSLKDYDWSGTTNLTLSGSNLTDEIVATWRLPSMVVLDLWDTKISYETSVKLRSKWPTIRTLYVHDEDKSSPSR